MPKLKILVYKNYKDITLFKLKRKTCTLKALEDIFEFVANQVYQEGRNREEDETHPIVISNTMRYRHLLPKEE